MNKYRVYFERWGYVDVEALSFEDAEKKAYHEEVIEPDEGWTMLDKTKKLSEDKKEFE